jgi:hypothetical protein
VRRSVITVAALAVGLLPAASAAAAHSRAACTEGMSKINGVQVRTFCGPARATVAIGGRGYAFTQGSCTRTADYFSINIGATEIGASNPTKPYFGIFVGRMPGTSLPRAGRDGVYANAVIGFHSGAMRASVKGTLKLTNGRSKGTFTGSLILKSGAASGSFSC